MFLGITHGSCSAGPRLCSRLLLSRRSSSGRSACRTSRLLWKRRRRLRRSGRSRLRGGLGPLLIVSWGGLEGWGWFFGIQSGVDLGVVELKAFWNGKMKMFGESEQLDFICRRGTVYR